MPKKSNASISVKVESARKIKKLLSDRLWNHRDDRHGFSVQDGSTVWDIIRGSEELDLLHENGCTDDDGVWDPAQYYLTKDGQYVYKVDSIEDVWSVLYEPNDAWFYFC